MGSRGVKAAPAILGAFLVWSCWSALPAGSPKIGKGKPPASWITIDMLPAIGEGEAPAREVPSPFVSAAELEQQARAREAEEERRRASARASAKGPPEPPFRPFRLELESVLRFDGETVVRVSGQSVTVGGRVLGLDREEPPVLSRVGAGVAEFRHRGRVYVLDLRERKSVTIAPLLAAAPGEDGDG